MKIVFAGSPEFAVPALEKLNNTFGVAAVVTQPDRPVGRKQILTPTPVKAYAAAHGIPVYDYTKIREHAEDIKAVGADIMITCAYGQILTQEILNCFPKGVWNLHASLLPLYRGASPIQSAILSGEEYTGITVMKTELELDSGDILLVKRCKISDDTFGMLSNELSALAAEAAVEAVGLLKAGNVQLLMQDETKVTFCKKINKEDCKIDFSRPAEEVLRTIKAFSPSPAAYCNHGGVRLNILNGALASGEGKIGEVVWTDKHGFIVSCGKDAVHITELQPAGGKPMRAGDYVNGRKIKVGDILD